MPGFRGARKSSGLQTAAHRAARKQWLTYLEQVGSLPCTRCGKALYPGDSVHLDHNDDRVTYRGLACPRCNMRAGASLGGKRAAALKAVRQGKSAAYW